MPEYQSLYRKYRSQTFADLVGQDAASRALQGAIIGGRVSHAYLFSGSRGTGKTSAARLLAKAINCTGRARDSAEPCNKCQSCLEVTAGSALDQIVSRLTHIALAEKVQVDAEAMGLIARTAQGSMRDAVGLLDQLVPLAAGPISLEGARSLLGIADPRLLDSLLDHVLEGRAAEALEELNRVYSAGAELRQVVRGLLEGCRDRLLSALSRHDRATARRLSAVLDALLHLDGEVRRHAEPRFLVEATLARLAVEVGLVEQGITPPPAMQEQTSPPGSALRAVPTSPQGGEVAEETSPPGSALRAVPTSPQGGEVAEETSPPGSALRAGPTSPQGGEVAGGAEVLEKLSRTVRAAYLDAQPEVNGSTLVLWFRYGFHHQKAQDQSAQLLPLVRAWLGDQVKVEFKLREAAAESSRPAGKAPASPEDDPFVREVVRRFDGRVTRVKEVSE